MYDTICKLRNVSVMSDQDQGLAELSCCHFQKSKYIMTGNRIQISRRLCYISTKEMTPARLLPAGVFFSYYHSYSFITLLTFLHWSCFRFSKRFAVPRFAHRAYIVIMNYAAPLFFHSFCHVNSSPVSRRSFLVRFVG